MATRRQSCGRQHPPVKALNDNVLQHAVASDDVTVVTGRVEYWLAKKSGPGGPLVRFRNRWGGLSIEAPLMRNGSYVVVFNLFRANYSAVVNSG